LKFSALTQDRFTFCSHGSFPKSLPEYYLD
jgi:hypothetical protein